MENPPYNSIQICVVWGERGPSVARDAGKRADHMLCIRSAFLTVANGIQTLKCDNFLVKHLFLILFSNYVRYDEIYKSRSMLDMFQNNFRDDKILRLEV